MFPTRNEPVRGENAAVPGGPKHQRSLQVVTEWRGDGVTGYGDAAVVVQAFSGREVTAVPRRGRHRMPVWKHWETQAQPRFEKKRRYPKGSEVLKTAAERRPRNEQSPRAGARG